jgi:hypothetical protein
MRATGLVDIDLRGLFEMFPHPLDMATEAGAVGEFEDRRDKFQWPGKYHYQHSKDFAWGEDKSDNEIDAYIVLG